jgi:type IV secretion system protein TrbD
METEPILGFTVPVRRSLSEPILLGGAPRAVAILNGTLAAAPGLGLRLWLAGLLLGLIGQAAAAWAATLSHGASAATRAVQAGDHTGSGASDDGIPHRAVASSRPSVPLHTIGAW